MSRLQISDVRACGMEEDDACKIVKQLPKTLHMHSTKEGIKQAFTEEVMTINKKTI